MIVRPLACRLLALAALFTLVACDKADSDSDDDEDDGISLVGTWTVPCGSDDEPGEEGATFDTSTDVISATGLQSTLVSYGDEGCSTEKHYTFNAEGTYVLGGAVTTPEGAYAYDIKATSVAITVHDEGYLAFFNGTNEGGAAVCGGGFELEVKKAVTAADCESTEGFSSLFETSYTIVKVDGNKLFQGDDGEDGTATDGSTADKRTKTLAVRPYIKQ